jgi:hypothetical protein
MDEFMTTTGAAQFFTDRGHKLLTWQVRRAYETGLMAEPEMRLGTYRIIKVTDLPKLEKALIELQYLPADVHIARGKITEQAEI